MNEVPPEGCVLTLDLSSVVGVCADLLEQRLPRFFGTWKLPLIGGEGARYCAFENELAATIKACRPSRIVMEKTLPIQALIDRNGDWHSTQRVVEQQYTLRGFAYSEAYRSSIPISEISADMARITVIGRCRWPKGTKVKNEIVQFCRSVGIMVDDDAQADATIIWLWHKWQLLGKSARDGPLFRPLRAV